MNPLLKIAFGAKDVKLQMEFTAYTGNTYPSVMADDLTAITIDGVPLTDIGDARKMVLLNFILTADHPKVSWVVAPPKPIAQSVTLISN